MTRCRFSWFWIALALACPVTGHSQEEVVAEYALAKLHTLHRSVSFPGTTASRFVSLVASEGSGLVVELVRREGEEVQRGQVIAEMRRAPTQLELASMEAQLKEAEARMNLAQISLNRSKELFDSEILSQQRLDESHYEVQAWEGRVERLKAETALLADRLENLTVTAPFDGVIISESVQVGEWVDSGDTVVEMASINRLEVKVAVPEKYFANLQLGAEADIMIEALSKSLNGKVTAINPSADLRARTFNTKIQIEPVTGLGIGMMAQVSIAIGEPFQTVIVPKDALVDKGDRVVLYRLGAEDRIDMLQVDVGIGVGQWVAIVAGVDEGDRIVVRGNERFRPNQMALPRLVEVPLP